jgi:hypothetical protein
MKRPKPYRSAQLLALSVLSLGFFMACEKAGADAASPQAAPSPSIEKGVAEPAKESAAVLVAPATPTVSKPEKAPPLADAPAKKAPLPDPSGLTLLHKGKAPHRKLALRLEPGTKGKVETTSQSTIKGGPQGDVIQPTMNVPMEWKIIDGSAETGWNFSVNVRMPKPPGGFVGGSKMPETVDFRGRVYPDGKAKVEKPEGFKGGAGMLIALLTSELGKNSVYLPSDPVGVGAKWKKEQTTDVMMMVTVTTTHYEITKMDDDSFEATLTTEIVIPGEGPVSVKGDSQAKMVWHANQPFPASLVTDLKMVSTAKAEDGSPPQITRITTRIEHQSKLEP